MSKLPEADFKALASVAERIDEEASRAALRAQERDRKVHRSRSRSWLERQAFTSRLATHVFKVQRNGPPVVLWPMGKVREWLGRLGLERDYIDDLEHQVALRHYRYLKKEGDPRLALLAPEHPGKRRKRLRKD